MNDSNSYSFLAVISIVLPGHDNATNIEVVLAPTDSITIAGGEAKPLQECSLADLGYFAGELEKELWASYLDIPLVELALDDETQITISLPDSEADNPSEFALWTEHLAVVDRKIITSDEEPSTDHLAHQAADLDREGAATADLTDKEAHLDENVGDAAAVLLEQAKVEEDEEQAETLAEALEAIEVDVSEPELVHEERVVDEEIDKGPPKIIEPTDIRILGRRRPPNHPTWTAADILINENAFRDAQLHASSSLNREVAGILVGPTPEKQPDGRYVVHIIDSIIAKHTKMHGASVTYTPESWRYLNDKLSELYPDESAVIVGWYHTHPGFGIFLSSMDRFIHQNFFVQKWHIALVLDPVANRSGFFCWDRKQELVDSYDFPWPQWAKNSW